MPQGCIVLVAADQNNRLRIPQDPWVDSEAVDEVDGRQDDQTTTQTTLPKCELVVAC